MSQQEYQPQQIANTATQLTETKSNLWDKSIENVLIKSSLGFIGGSLLCLPLARSTSARFAIVGLGVGFGAGQAYHQNCLMFDAQQL